MLAPTCRSAEVLRRAPARAFAGASARDSSGTTSASPRVGRATTRWAPHVACVYRVWPSRGACSDELAATAVTPGVWGSEPSTGTKATSPFSVWSSHGFDVHSFWGGFFEFPNLTSRTLRFRRHPEHGHTSSRTLRLEASRRFGR